jgi:MoxR-like ATPase
MVLATQNPIEYEGTFPLPEAQLDRFIMRLSMGYPEAEDERIILNNLRREHPIVKLGPIREPDTRDVKTEEEIDRINGDNLKMLLLLQRLVWDIHIDETLQDYIIRLVGTTREHPDILLGASPRASLALYKTAQALASIRGRDHVIPDDIKFLAPYTLTHRLLIKPESELRGRTARYVMDDIIQNTLLDFGQIQT